MTGKTPTVGSAPAFNGSAGSNAAGGNLPAGFDVENRLIAPTSSLSYGYDPWGRRVWVQTNNGYFGTTNESMFYGATGQKLETYTVSFGSEGPAGQTLEGGISTYFAGRMLSEKGVYVAMDRLGSVRGDSAGLNISYFPWGEERGPGTANNRTKFAGYYRDAPGQDYAMARYYSATSGSFWSPDPGSISTADPTNPTSWNRYGYATGDPINYRDPSGRDECPADACVNAPDWCSGSEKYYDASCDSYSGGGGGGGDPTPPNPGGDGSGADAPSNAALLQSSTARVGADLSKPDCAKDFASVSDTVSEMANIKFSDKGEFSFRTNKKGKQVGHGEYGHYNSITGTITINSNSNINWGNLSQSTALVNGVQTAFDAIASEIAFLGLPAGTQMSSAQMMDLVVLHELAHFDGTVGSPDKATNELKLWNDCVK